MKKEINWTLVWVLVGIPALIIITIVSYAMSPDKTDNRNYSDYNRVETTFTKDKNGKVIDVETKEYNIIDEDRSQR